MQYPIILKTLHATSYHHYIHTVFFSIRILLSSNFFSKVYLYFNCDQVV
uniref:Uncharacterized protein n=1 Tax=Anguilla anguilla TaxID=7936 RepID=A0A0E9V368_ANGAN